MLVELSVRDLGVIEQAAIDLGPGMTALTGETGAGKTLLVEALELLLGGRADPALVRPGAEEALVEGRFLEGDVEVVLKRGIADRGRSRAWVDGRMAPVAALAEVGGRLVDLHSQHGQQSLLDQATQRRALDAFGRVDLEPLASARGRVRTLRTELDALGGDDRARARDMDLLRFQLDDIDAAALQGPDEDDTLAAEEDRLAEASAHRQAAATALGVLDADSSSAGAVRGGSSAADGGGAVDLLGQAAAALAGRAPLEPVVSRLAALQ
ncbi:MAG: AAA family ATPase, partial [Acidimicrobiales bacterium]